MDLKPHFEQVERVIKSLGIDPASCRGDKEGQWNLKKGSANVWIDVFYSENNKNTYFQCMSPVSAIPQNNKIQFYEEVLEIAHKLYGVGMTKYRDGIYVKAIREVNGLDDSEIVSTLNRIGNYADDYDDYFNNKYFGNDGEGGGNAPV